MHPPAEQRPAGRLAIATRRFGAPETVDIDAASLYTFPDALPGLPDSHRYALIADPAYAPLRWLQSLDEEAVCLPVLGVRALSLGGYAAHLERAIGLDAAAVAERVLLVTRYDASAGTFVANLLAPIVLDPASGAAAQVVLDDRAYPLRQPLLWHAETRTFSPPC